MTRDFQKQAITLIDDLKGVCANYGLGNDGNEFKIITQIFLYKFLNDKFAHEVKQIDPKLAKAASWEDALRKTKKTDYEMLLLQLGGGTARLRPEHFLASLYARQNEPDFAKTLDATLLSIAALNSDNLGTKVKDGKNQKTLLSTAEEDQIIRVFNAREAVEDFSVVVSYEEIAAKNHSLSAGQYFDVKVEHVAITPKEFEKELARRKDRLNSLFEESGKLEKQIKRQLGGLNYD